jgi:hypothetical protein
MRALALLLLLAGLGFAGYALFSASRVTSVNETVLVVPLTDATEIASQLQAAAGTYLTGNKPGDRTIVIGPDGRVTFSELGATAVIDHGADTCQVGRRGKKICLTTTHSGVIEVVNIETIVYYRDTYERTR